MDFDLRSLIETFGYLGIFSIVYVESGLLLGFFLPGDSLLFTAGFLASQGVLDLNFLILIIFIAAVLGDSTGYSLGRRFGPRVFARNSRVFNQEHLTRSEAFYKKHGGKTLILARFTPVVRTFAPVLAGVGKMAYRRFLAFNVIGAVIWAVSVPLLGYYLGQSIPNIERYLIPTIILAVLLSLAPSIWHLMRHSGERRRLATWFKQKFSKS